MRRFMRASGAESLNVAASIFMGQTEAPLTIRPFLPRMTESELMTVMTAGMAHISGGVMAAYILFGVEAQHLLTAVIMTAPGTLMMAKLFVPETGEPETMGTVKLAVEKTDVNVIDAIGRGTGEGLHLALNVGAMLISFLALVALLNAGLGLIGQAFGIELSLQLILRWVFAPIAWALGVPWRDAATIGNLLGTRMVLNEFVAFSQLGPLKATLDPKSFTIATFALCGFANFSSIGIQIGGIGALAPERRHDLARLGLRAMLAGTFANFLTATICWNAAVTFERVEEAAAARPQPLWCLAAGRHRPGLRPRRFRRHAARLRGDAVRAAAALAGVERHRPRRPSRRRLRGGQADRRARRARALLRGAHRSRRWCSRRASWRGSA